MASLYEISETYQQALQDLSDMPPEDVADTLEGLSGELLDKGRNVAAYMLNLDAEAEAMANAEAKIAARRKAIQAKSQRMRDYLRDNMSACGISKISCPEFSVTLCKPSIALSVDSESLIPPEYINTKVTTSLSRKAITDALKAGKAVPGASLTEAKPRLLIK